MPLIRTEQQRPYNIHPVDIPADKVYYEKPSRVPTFEIDVLAVTVLCALLAGLLFWALFNSVRAGIGCGAGFGLLVAFWRVWTMLGDPFPEIKETTFQRVQIDTEGAGGRTIPVNHNGERRTEVELRGPKTLTHNGRTYQFEGWQLDRMLDWVQKGYDSIRRDQTGENPGLSQIGITAANYSIVLFLFQQHGIIDDTNKWTEAGREWLRAI